VAILIVEQNVRRALSIARRGYLLNLGRIAMEAPAADILADGRLEGLYLGSAARMLGPR
jgi:branched-chain amino acid transport system ATP-binding protein